MRLSVCMPYWKRQAELDRSLAAYAAIYPPGALEISICDDGSPVPVKAPGCIVTSLPPKRVGLNPCVPMNRAVRASSCDVVVITNPEIEHREDVFSDMLALLETESDYVVATCKDVDGLLLAGEGVNYRTHGRLPVPPGSHFHFCAMLHRSLFERVNGFDEIYRYGRSCEDNDWLWSLHSVGARFRLSSRTVWHYKTPHEFAGDHERNRSILVKRWSELWP